MNRKDFRPSDESHEKYTPHTKKWYNAIAKEQKDNYNKQISEEHQASAEYKQLSKKHPKDAKKLREISKEEGQHAKELKKLEKKNYYSKKYPKGIKYNNGDIEIEYQKEGKQLRAIVFDNRDKTVHDYYGKNKKDVTVKAMKDYPKVTKNIEYLDYIEYNNAENKYIKTKSGYGDYRFEKFSKVVKKDGSSGKIPIERDVRGFPKLYNHQGDGYVPVNSFSSESRNYKEREY